MLDLVTVGTMHKLKQKLVQQTFSIANTYIISAFKYMYVSMYVFSHSLPFAVVYLTVNTTVSIICKKN